VLKPARFSRRTLHKDPIEYGRAAHQNITVKSLVITAGRAANGDVAFVCGVAVGPVGFAMTVPEAWKYTTVAPQYLPATCRR
jgi:hypothetical protein